MDKDLEISNKGSWISLLVGAPIGVAMVVSVFALSILLIFGSTGEGLGAMAFYVIYINSIIGMLFAFLLSLWFTGRVAEYYLLEGRGLLFTSFMYSLVTNAVIWFVFIVVNLYGYFDLFLGVIVPLIAFILSTVLSVFTVGLLICYLIKKRIG